MANLISRVTGNWLTAATWGLVDTTSLLISQAGNAIVPTSGGSTARSSAFTPGAITIDGIAIKLGTRNGTSGTLTVELWNNTLSAVVAATTVTINTADLPTALVADKDGGWIVFQFASVLLLAGNAYMVQCTTSSSNQVILFTDATTNNWSRLLRTTTTQAPAAGDDMLVAGELTGAGTHNSFTVTMNSTTATDYGSAVADGSSITPALAISNFGTLTNGTTAATNYILRLSGNLANFQNGTVNIGTTGTPIPRDSTAVVEFDCAADADFGWHNHGGTCNLQGLSRTSGKNIVSCKLNTDEAAAQTVLGVDTDTGWLSGDQIGIASTSQTIGDRELRTLSVNASATQLTISAGLTNAHSGTSPTQAEVINLTRNVKIRSVSSTAMTFFHCNKTASVDVDWTEFSQMGNSTITDWRGVVAETTTGSFNMQFCALHDFEAYGFYMFGSLLDNITFSNNVLYEIATVTGWGGTIVDATTGTNITINNNVMIAILTTGFSGWFLADIGIVFTDNTVTSATKYGAVYSQNSESTFGTFSGQVYHSCGQGGFQVTAGNMSGTLSSYKIWRNAVTYGVNFLGGNDITLNDFVAFGNDDSSIFVSSDSPCVLRINNLISNGDTSFTSLIGILVGAGVCAIIIVDNSDLSTVTGIKTAHTADISFQGPGKRTAQMFIRNTLFGAATEVDFNSNLTQQLGFVSSEKHNRIAGNHKTWLRGGVVPTDTAIFNTASPSMRMTPISTIYKLESASLFRGLKVAVNNGGTVTVNCYTRKSTAGDGAAYNGAQPRLIVRANPALGTSFNTDTVLDTHTAAAGTWEQLTGTTATVTDNGCVEMIVDCDGTVGWVNVDDWSVS